MQSQLKIRFKLLRNKQVFQRRCCQVVPYAQQPKTSSQRWDQQFENSDFDLDLAVALAGCAFESYLEPEIETSRKEIASNYTETTYMDGEFVKKELLGLLEISDVKASNLPQSGQVYAQISLTRSTVWTDSVDADQHSDSTDFSWTGKLNQDSEVSNGSNSDDAKTTTPFNIFLHRIPNQREILKIRLFQKSSIPLRSDESRGTGMMPIVEGELLDGNPHNVQFSLRGEGSTLDSKICFTLKYDPLEEGEEQSLLGQMTKQKVQQAFPKYVPQMLQKSFWEKRPQVPDKFKDFFLSLGETYEKMYPEESVPSLSEVLRRMNIIAEEAEKEDQQAVDELNMKLEGAGEQMDEEKRKQLELTKQWKELSMEVGYFLGGLNPIAYIENPETDTQAWVYRNVGAKEMVIAFRGTEQVKWKDFTTDINLLPVAFNPERVDDGDFFSKLFKKKTEPLVHQGFSVAYNSVRGQIFGMVDDVTQDESDWTVFVTGHSLGGALATLCSYELTQRQANKGQKIRMYSYGAPRVGNKKYAQMYNEVVQDSWRIINTNDLVPQIPRLLGYCHVKQCVLVDKDKEEFSLVVHETDIFGEGKAYDEIFEKFYYEVQEKDIQSVASTILEYEMQILNSLVDGSALAEHMENLYLLSLRSVLMKNRML